MPLYEEKINSGNSRTTGDWLHCSKLVSFNITLSPVKNLSHCNAAFCQNFDHLCKVLYQHVASLAKVISSLRASILLQLSSY